MKNKLIILILMLFGFTLTATATSGGSITVRDLSYNPADESIYYTQHIGGESGCPPELVRLDLNTLEGEKIYSCYDEYWKEAEEVLTDIDKRTEGYKKLSKINLTENNFSIEIEHMEEIIRTDYPEKSHSIFEVTVLQYDNITENIILTGCDIKQPFLFQGYAIPELDQRIILTISATSKCFEMGYVDDRIFSISGITDIDISKQEAPKTQDLALIDEESLLVFERNNQPKDEILDTYTIGTNIRYPWLLAEPQYQTDNPDKTEKTNTEPVDTYQSEENITQEKAIEKINVKFQNKLILIFSGVIFLMAIGVFILKKKKKVTDE